MYTFNLETEFNYGRYNGRTLKEVLFADHSYILWSIEQIEKFKIGGDVIQFLGKDLTIEQVLDGINTQSSICRGYLKIEHLLCAQTNFDLRMVYDFQCVEDIRKDYLANFQMIKENYLNSEKFIYANLS